MICLRSVAIVSFIQIFHQCFCELAMNEGTALGYFLSKKDNNDFFHFCRREHLITQEVSLITTVTLSQLSIKCLR